LDLITLIHIQQIQHNVFYEAYKYSTHAEKSAIMSVKNKNKKLLSSSIIVIVKLNDGKIVQAKPCEMCQNLLDKYKVSKICTLCGDKIIKI
jgi:cytidine deaminase